MFLRENNMKSFKTLFILCILSVLTFLSCGGDEEGEQTEANKPCSSNADCNIGYVCDLTKGKCIDPDSADTGDSGHHGDTDISDSSDTSDTSDSGDSGDSGSHDTFCEAGKILRCDPDDFYKVIRCNLTGSAEESVPCGDMSVCDNDKCIQQKCTPGSKICSSSDLSKIFKCSEKGLFTDEPVEDCGKGTCDNGECLTLCDQAAKSHSYQGCDFFTAIYMSAGSRPDPIFALTISNTSKTNSVNVSITASSESGEVDAGLNYFCIDSEDNCQTLNSTQSLSVEAGRLGIIMFPNDRNIKGQGMKWNSLHITTDLPVTIYQFSPIDNSTKNPFESSGISAGGDSFYGKSYSNDASLLIPSSSVYTDYVVTASAAKQAYTTYATIIGLHEGGTTVTVRPNAAIPASNGIPAITANTEGQITVQRGQIAQIEISSDMSGTRIFCDTSAADCHPFAVFSGTNCANIPATYGYCDHIEQQLFPVQTWGRKYILVKSQARGEEWDYVRIYASKDGTTLTFKPATPEKISVPSGWISFTVNDVKTELNAGEYSEFYFKGTLEVEANNQIMVAQYLTASEMLSKSCQSSGTSHNNCVGDPAMMLIPPSEQFRKDYLFLTPGSYVSNFATIVMKTGESPILDGSAVTDIHEIEGTGFSYAIVDLGSAFANHTLTCENNPCGLFVYGWEKDVSYAYPGGLNLEKLSTN